MIKKFAQQLMEFIYISTNLKHCHLLYTTSSTKYFKVPIFLIPMGEIHFQSCILVAVIYVKKAQRKEIMVDH